MKELLSAKSARETADKYNKEKNSPRLLKILEDIKLASFVGAFVLHVENTIQQNDIRELELLGYTVKKMGNLGSADEYLVGW